MRTTSLLIIIVLLLAIFSASAMAASMLEFKDITVEVDGDRQSANEGGGTIKVTPESKLVMKIKVTNLYDSGVAGGDIENIQVIGTLEEIDDGDDLEEEADDFDLRPGRDKTVTLTYDIPLRLYTDDTYKLTLDMDGEDKNGTTHTQTLEFDVNIDKENHELRFMRKEISPDKVSCTRTANIRVDFINTGESDEDVELTITSSELGYNKVQDITLAEDIDDDDNEYSFTDSLNLNNVKPGTYTVKVHASYNRNKKSLDEALPITVEQCGSTQEEEEEEEPVQTPATTTTQTTTQPTQTTTTTQPVQTQPTTVEVVTAPTTSYVRSSQLVATPRTDYNNSWWADNKWLMVFLITDLVLVIAGIIVIMLVLKRRR